MGKGVAEESMQLPRVSTKAARWRSKPASEKLKLLEPLTQVEGVGLVRDSTRAAGRSQLLSKGFTH